MNALQGECLIASGLEKRFSGSGAKATVTYYDVIIVGKIKHDYKTEESIRI